MERSIRPLALTRKNVLFAGSDGEAEHWAVIASLIESCKHNGIDAQAYLADVIIRIVNDHPNRRIDDLMPSAYPAQAVLSNMVWRRRLQRIRRKVYCTRDEARRDVFGYIEMFYNSTRQHARNGMLSPIEFERQHKAKAEGALKTRSTLQHICKTSFTPKIMAVSSRCYAASRLTNTSTKSGQRSQSGLQAIRTIKDRD